MTTWFIFSSKSIPYPERKFKQKKTTTQMEKSSINIYGCNENNLWGIVFFFFSFAIIYLKCKLHVCIFGSNPCQGTKIGIGVENACMLLLFF